MGTEKTANKKIVVCQGFSLQQHGGGVIISKKLLSNTDYVNRVVWQNDDSRY